MSQTIVVGAGFGGLAAAIRLQAAGRLVTLVESSMQLGGRAGRIEDGGYTFDMGPTIITAPHLLEDLWSAAGRDLHADVDLVPLRPYYQIRFRDGTSVDYGPKLPLPLGEDRGEGTNGSPSANGHTLTPNPSPKGRGESMASPLDRVRFSRHS